VHVWLKSISNEGYFTVEAEIVLRVYVALQWSGMNETSNVALHMDSLYAVKVWLKSVSNEGYFIVGAETNFPLNTRAL
jgi:hypothetical protein